MSFEEIVDLLKSHLGTEIIIGEVRDTPQPQLLVAPDRLIAVCDFVKKNDQCFFDSLSCITAIDNGPQKGTIEVLYHLYSIPFHHFLVIKVEINRDQAEIPSVSPLWRTADWHEREAYDFFGIQFTHHPDLRRILLPADWEGFPLRKDYKEQETYHGIKVVY